MDIAKNHLDKIFEEFKERVVHVSFTQSFTKSVSKAAMDRLSKEYETARNQDRESSPSRMTNMICKDLLRNQEIVIGFKDSSYAEHLQILQLQHNRQYQWLLAEAYEAFEDFLKRLYAYCGYVDKGFWKDENFKGIAAEEITRLELDWFIKKAKPKPLEEMLKQINSRIPSLPQILAIRRRDDPLNIDYEFTAILISKLRHKIVHAHGYANKQKFIESRLKECPLANILGPEKQSYIDVMNSLFGNGQLENLIALLELHDPRQPMMFVDRLGDLLARLTSYAMLLHGLVKNQLAGKPAAKLS